MGKVNYFKREYRVPFNLPIFAYVLWKFSENCNRREFSYKEIKYLLQEVERRYGISIGGIFNHYNKLSNANYGNISYVLYLLHVFGDIYRLINYNYKGYLGREDYIIIIVTDPKGLEELAKEAEFKYRNNIGFIKLKEGLDRILSEIPGCRAK